MPSGPEVLSLPELVALLGRCRQTVYRQIARGTLPAPITKYPSTWSADEVRACLASRRAPGVAVDPAASPLQQARQRLGLTQHRAAALLAVSPTAVSRWERGGRVPLKYRRAVGLLLGVPGSSLEDGDPEAPAGGTKAGGR